MEAIAIWLEAIAIWLEAIAVRLAAIVIWLEAIAIWLSFTTFSFRGGSRNRQEEGRDRKTGKRTKKKETKKEGHARCRKVRYWKTRCECLLLMHIFLLHFALEEAAGIGKKKEETGRRGTERKRKKEAGRRVRWPFGQRFHQGCSLVKLMHP